MPGLVRSPGEGNGYPLLYCLENSMDRVAWQATFHGGHKESDTTERLSLNFTMERQTYRRSLWAQWGKETEGQIERVALKHTPPYVK